MCVIKVRGMDVSGKPYWRGRFSTIDLLINIGGLVKRENIVSVWNAVFSKLVSTRRSSVLILSLQWGFPGCVHSEVPKGRIFKFCSDLSQGILTEREVSEKSFCDTQHNKSVIMLSVAFYLLLCCISRIVMLGVVPPSWPPAPACLVRVLWINKSGYFALIKLFKTIKINELT
jgi:hypothetical protein